MDFSSFLCGYMGLSKRYIQFVSVLVLGWGWVVREVKVEVIGPEPPCVRCEAAWRVVMRVAEKLREVGVVVRVEKANIMSKEVVQKYGLLFSPAIAINGRVRIVGRVPSLGEVEKLVLEAAG